MAVGTKRPFEHIEKMGVKVKKEKVENENDDDSALDCASFESTLDPCKFFAIFDDLCKFIYKLVLDDELNDKKKCRLMYAEYKRITGCKLVNQCISAHGMYLFPGKNKTGWFKDALENEKAKAWAEVKEKLRASKKK